MTPQELEILQQQQPQPQGAIAQAQQMTNLGAPPPASNAPPPVNSIPYRPERPQMTNLGAPPPASNAPPPVASSQSQQQAAQQQAAQQQAAQQLANASPQQKEQIKQMIMKKVSALPPASRAKFQEALMQQQQMQK